MPDMATMRVLSFLHRHFLERSKEEPDNAASLLGAAMGVKAAMLLLTEPEYQTRQANHEEPEGYPCEQCGAVFKTSQGRGMHRTRVHADKPKTVKLAGDHGPQHKPRRRPRGTVPHKFQCPGCDKGYESMSSLRSHWRYHPDHREVR